MTILPLISVIIPVYNGSAFIGKTLDSILNQKFFNFEVICIDDCSTDGSKEIINRYALNDSRIRPLSTHSNLGIVPKVINFGLPFIRGEFFVYSSQDDIFSTDWLESMYQKAIDTGADAVIPDIIFYYENLPEKNKLLSGLNGNKTRVLTNREAFVYSLDWTIPGYAMWRVWLIRKFGYFDFGMNADEYTARVYFLNCNKVVFSNGTFYYRQDNPEAITKKLSVKMFDIPYTDLKLWELIKVNNFPVVLQEQLLLRSIKGLLHYRSQIINNKNIAGGILNIKRCLYAFEELGIFEILKNSKNKKLRSLPVRLAVKNIFYLGLISYIYLIRNYLFRNGHDS